MLTLIEGGFFSGGAEALRKSIQELTNSGKKSILIVPEQQTVVAEIEMASILPPSAPLYFEVTNFTRFTNTVFRSLGGLARPSAKGAARSLIMWRALTELSVVLESDAGRGQLNPGVTKRMLSAVAELQSAAISPEELMNAASALKKSSADQRLIFKMRDLSKVASLYKKILNESFSDGDDDLISAAERINSAKGDFLSDTAIFIDGFTSFTEPQYALLRALIKRCDITVSLILPKHPEGAYEYTETRGTHSRIVKLCGGLSEDARLIRLSGRNTANDSAITEAAELIWRTSGKIDPDSLKGESIKVYEAENPHEECDFVASDIKRRVMAGASYSDFGIIARGTESYSGIIENAFDKAKIPLFTSSSIKPDSYEVIRLIYSAVSAISGGYNRRDVISFAKCSLSGISTAEADELELYCERWQISGKRFTDGELWNMNPDGYSERRSKDASDFLIRVNQAKEKLIAPLMTLEANISRAERVREFAECLVEFLNELRIEEKLAMMSADGISQKYSSLPEDYAKLWQLICDALDALCLVTGELNTNCDDFLTLLKIAFSGTDIGRIPSFSEQVTFGDAKTARMPEKKHIYIIGACAGVFPAPMDNESYFTEKDRRAMADAGLSMNADDDARCASELYYLVRAVSFAKSGLTVLYHTTDAELKPSAPSEAIARLCEISDGKIVPKKISVLPAADVIFTPEYAIENIGRFNEEKAEIKRAVSDAGFGEILRISEKNIKNSKLKLTNESLDSLYGSTIRMSQSKLDRYIKCPMSYFCSYNLGLRAEEKHEFDSRSIGNFLHAILENFFRELRQRGCAIHAITEEEKLTLIRRCANEYISLCFEGIPKASPRVRLAVEKLCVMAKPIVDSLCDEFRGSKYEPVFFELEIEKGKDGSPSPAVFHTEDGKEIYVAGKIDRVDLFHTDEETFVRVADYKTGAKVFSPSDIEKGVNLQMFLYLKSVVETENEGFLRAANAVGKRLVPAGVLYVKTDVSSPTITHDSTELAIEAVKSAQSRAGMLLDEEESLAAMNSDFIPIKFKKDGFPDARSLDKLYSRNGWVDISRKVERAVVDICEEMLSGNIPAKPLAAGGRSPCEYCEFKSICRR